MGLRITISQKVVYKIYFVLLSLVTYGSCAFHFKLGYKLNESVEITSLVKLSPEECIKECQAREACLSIQTDNRFRLCCLSSSDTSTLPGSLERSPGTWYSEKSSWRQRGIDPRCNDQCSAAETCRLSGEEIKCEVLECPKQQRFDAVSEIQGSMLSVGSNSVHTCPLNRTRAVSTCGADGEWSLQQFTCPISTENPVTLATTSTPVRVCGANWVAYQGSCYLLENSFRTFTAAKDICANLNARLVRVETEEKNQMFKDNLLQGTTQKFWIGMTDIEYEGRWVWDESYTNVTYFDWEAGEGGENLDENCAIFSYSWKDYIYRWDDIDCIVSARPICEK